MIRSFAHFVIGIALTSLVFAQDMRTVQAVRVGEPFVIDGSLSEPGWSMAPVVDASLEVDPRENAPAPQRTDIRFAYDDRFFYVSYVCYETDMAALRAQVTERDNMYQDDYTILILDPFGDQQKAYEFMVNPRNIQGDGLMSQGGDQEDMSYEMIWYSAVTMEPDRWTVEMAIPFKSFRFPDVPEQTWNILAGRNYPRETRAILSASPYDRNNPCLLCQTMKLTGISGISPGLALEVLPYAIATQQGSLRDTDDPTTPFEQGKLLGRAGVGVKVAPTPDITIEGVLNPDFSQIESDAAQISVNTTFALFYPERRPFFLEGSDLFRPGMQGFFGPSLQVFYSRTVNDPILAAKVIGKSGGLSYGLLSASDRNTNLFIPGEEESDIAETGRRSFINVARIRYDIGESAYIGGLATTRHLSGDGSNIVAGVDWNYRFWENFSITGIVFGSRTQEPNATAIFSDTRMFGSTGRTAAYDGEQFTGVAGLIRIARSAREVNYSLSYEDVSPLFQAQNGFITRTNKRSLTLAYGRIFYPEEGGFITRWDISGNTGFQLNYDGQRKERFAMLGVSASLRGQLNISMNGLLLNQELFKGVFFKNMPRLFANINWNPTSYLEMGAHVQAGNFAYRETPPELGYGHNVSLSTRVRFTERLDLSLQYSRARLSSSASGALFYDGNIYRSTAIYQFSPEMFVRLIGEYSSFDQALSVYPLFSFKLNPFTVFYAGATREGVNFGVPSGFVTTQTNYFLKLQYLIQG